MRRFILALILTLLVSAGALAQSTTVTGTVTDTGGVVWIAGTYEFDFVGSTIVTWPGGTVPRIVKGSLSGTGTFSQSLPDNNTISPSPTFWTLKVCPIPGVLQSCFTQPSLTITGSTQTLTVTPPAITILGSTAPPVAAYADAEIVAPVSLGFTYYQVASATSGVTRQCTGLTGTACTTWSGVIGTGGTGGIIPAGVDTAARWSNDGSITNGSPLVDSASLNFTAADIKKDIWTVNQSTGLSKQIGHIVSVNSATEIVSDTNSTATETGDAIALGFDSAPALIAAKNAAWTTAPAADSTVLIPCGTMVIKAPPFLRVGNVSNNSATFGVSGCNAQPGTTFLLHPSITSSILTGGVIFFNGSGSAGAFPPGFHGPYPQVQNVHITSLGGLLPATSGTFFVIANALRMENVAIDDVGFGSGAASCSYSAGGGEGLYYDYLNFQQSNVLGAPCILVQYSGGQGSSTIAHSILAFTNNACIAYASGSGGQLELDDNYLTACGGSGSASLEMNSGGSGGFINIKGGEYTGGNNNPDIGVDAAGYTVNIDSALMLGATGQPVYRTVSGSTVSASKTFFQCTVAANCLGGSGGAGAFVDGCGNSYSTAQIAAGVSTFGSCSTTGTLATGGVALTSGWGTSSVASVAAGSDSHAGRITITGAAGAASPVLTLTFPATYLKAPSSCTLTENTTDLASLTSVAAGTPTTTTVAFTFAGTPVAVTYIFDYRCAQ